MQVIYTAPNRGHHYLYAEALFKANALAAFVSGFSRFSPRSNDIDVGDKLHRADSIQNIYLAALKYKLPKIWCAELAYSAKIQQDKACCKFLKGADVFMFYNGSGLHTLAAAKKRGVVTVVEAVNSHVEYQEQILETEYKELGLPWTPFHRREKRRRLQEYEQADYILMPSEFVRKSFLQYGFPEEKLLKVPYGFQQMNTHKINYKKDDVFTVLYVGSISVRKGLRYLFEAFDKLTIPNKKLVITGPTDHITGIESFKTNADVVFTGVLKDASLEEVYRSADVFCLPSIEEGLALVLGEALSFGLPVIATENSGASDIFDDGEEGFITPIKSSEAILEKLTLLANNSDLLNSMKYKAIAKASALNGWDATQSLLVKTLKYLCE